MKFAIAALLATTSAIRITADAQGKGCVTKKLAHEGFKALDTDDSGSLSYDEIKVGVEELAKSLDHVITADEWKWIQETGEKIDSKTPGKVDEKEFHAFANALFKHFDLCDLAREAEKEGRQARKCVDRKQAAEGFKMLDTNHNGSLSYDEIKAGLEELAKSQDHVITDAEWAWIQKTGERIDSKTPGKVDEKEFFRFANAVFRHFDLCHLAREERADDKAPASLAQGKGCVTKKLAHEGFKALDTDDSGSLSYDEIKVGVEELAKSLDHVITADEWKWIQETGEKIDSKTPGKVDEKEFHTFANALFKHFDLCDLAREAEKEGRQARKCVDRKQAAEGFKMLDTNHNGSLSYDEIKAGLEELAKSQDHVITDAEWAWIQKTGERIDSKTPGKVDEKEFFRFANAVFRHFDLCHLAREDRQ